MHRNTCARTRGDLDVDGLEAADGTLSVGELLVSLDSRCGIERRGLEAGAVALISGSWMAPASTKPRIAGTRKAGSGRARQA
jgi:hypothetical protein